MDLSNVTPNAKCPECGGGIVTGARTTPPIGAWLGVGALFAGVLVWMLRLPGEPLGITLQRFAAAGLPAMLGLLLAKYVMDRIGLCHQCKKARWCEAPDWARRSPKK